MISPENTGIPTCLIVLKLQATQFVHTLADVRRLKNSIANAIVSNVTVGLSKTAEQFRTLCTQSHCRLLHLWRGHGPDLWGSAFQMASTTGNLHQFQDQLHCVSMKDYEYTPITVMGAVAEAIATNIGVRVQHPQSTDLLIVHRQYQVRACVSFRDRPYIMCPKSYNLLGMGIRTIYLEMCRAYSIRILLARRLDIRSSWSTPTCRKSSCCAEVSR